MKKVYFTLVVLSSILMADKIGSTGPDGTVIITDDGGSPTVIFK